ncbi:O-antigen export system permease protein RfbD [Paramagnetospirillum magnetotacticum MS-1]|uniref:O-antigen export system permease protein RfbD n=2 Tax=Paramagnetospirillum magnetotacticum TaxID=188 RepID=A0A0C2YY69_PARME|nr:O-antigen export system permease protein RfbD [Paramagnetospirillum magnetotacticum MS-1]
MPVVILPLVIFAFSTGLVLSYMAVPFRDVPHLLQLFLMTNFWAIPITYHWSMVSDPTLSLLVKWHPLALLLAPIQVTLQSGSQPSMAVTTAAFSIAIVALAAALVLNALKRRTFILQI